MKKKILILAASTFSLLLLAVISLGIYVNANIEDITRKHLGAGIKYEQLSFRYSPMPNILLTDLEVDYGENRSQIPSLALFPNLVALLHGDFVLNKVVAERPVIYAHKQSGQSSGPQSSVNTILKQAGIPARRIKGLEVNKGKMFIKSDASKSDAYTSSPVSFALAMENIEKSQQSIKVEVKNFYIEELGIRFAGNIAVSSLAPLKLKVDAPQATVSPQEIKDFLVRFGFINKEIDAQIPGINEFAAQGFKLNIDMHKNKFELSSNELSFEDNKLQNIALNLQKKGRYKIQCEQIGLDVGTMQKWVRQNPQGKKVLKDLLQKARLQELDAQGEVNLSAVQLSGRQGQTSSLNGSLDLKAKGLKIHLVSQTGEEQDFTIKQLETSVNIEQGQPSVKMSKLQLSSLQGGSGLFSSLISLPLKAKDIEFAANFNSLSIFETEISGRAGTKDKDPLRFDLSVTNPPLGLQAKGLLNLPANKNKAFEARLSKLQINNKAAQNKEAKDGQKKSGSQDFDLRMLKGQDIKAKAFVNSLAYNELPELKNLDLSLNCQAGKADLQGSLRVCQTNVNLQTVLLAPDKVVAQVDGKGSRMDLTSFIACFSDELPVFLTGKMTVMANIFTRGKNADELLRSAQGEVVLNLSQITVHKISNLDRRLAFFLDMFKTAGIKIVDNNSIKFNKGMAKASLKNGRVILKRFSLQGPLLDTWGQGKYIFADKHLQLNGKVRTNLGITKVLHIDRILKKSKT